MDCDNVRSDHGNESSKTVEQCPPYYNISANTNPAHCNMPHYGPPEFLSNHNCLATPCHGNMNSRYNPGNVMEHGNGFHCAQPRNAAMERKNCPQMQPKSVHHQARGMRSNRNKKLYFEKNKSHFPPRPQFMNYINTENNNQQKIFDTRANVCHAVPESQLLSTGDVGNRNNVLLNQCSSTDTNLQYSSLGTNQINLQRSSASGNRTNSSTNFKLNDALLTAASGTTTLGLDCDTGGETVYFQDETITIFANKESSASNQLIAFDDVLTKSIPDVESTQPLDQAQLLDASRENLLLNGQKTTNLVTRNNTDGDGEEKKFTLQTICKGKNESGKDVILVLTAPVQQQIAQGNGSVDRSVETQRVQCEENASTRAGTIENTVIGNENNLQFAQNDAMENSQEVENINDDGNATFTSNLGEHFGHEVVVKTSRLKKRKRQTSSANTQNQCKKCNKSNSEAETDGLEGSSQMNLDEIHPCPPRCNKSNSEAAETDGLEGSSQRNLDEMHSCQPRCRRENFNRQSWRARLKWKNNCNSFKDIQNQYFSRFAREYFKEKHINDRELQQLMREMLSRIGGSVMQSIWCSFDILKTNYYNARTRK